MTPRLRSLAGAATALAAAAALAGCEGTVGTVDVTLITAPGSTVLANVETLRLVLTNPHQVQTATRTNGAFSIDLQLAATGDTGALLVDGLDASGTVIATGASPPFPIGGVSADVAIYMAAPNSVAAAPVTLDPPRSELAAGALSYGAVFAGGRLADGTASAATGVYNAFSHQLQLGLDLPAAKAAIALAVGTSGHVVYLFGGSDAGGTATASVERFDTSVAPSGQMTELGPFAGFARSGETALSIGDENILVTGAPVAELAGTTSTVTARAEVPALPRAGAAVVGNDGVAAAIFAGASGVIRFRSNQFDALSVTAAARDGADAVALPGGKVGIACGNADLARIDAGSGSEDVLPGVPTEARSGCAVAATTRHLLIAGGITPAGDLVPTAELFDAATLQPIATLPLVVPRTGATATPLANGQILIAGGTDATGAPIATIELFTPDSPE